MISFSDADKKKIRDSILNKYRAVASSVIGQFRYPTGEEGLKKLGYPQDILKLLPPETKANYVGVGNPFMDHIPYPGDTILDIGCGAGVDTLVAALITGPEGQVLGIDISPEMIKKAKDNKILTQIHNARFKNIAAEDLDMENESIDLIVSNGVLNLIVDKESVLKRAFALLKKGGRIQIADQILRGVLPSSRKELIDSWFT